MKSIMAENQINTIANQNISEYYSRLITWSVITLSVCMNHSANFLGFNASVADILVLIVTITTLLSGRLVVNYFSFIFLVTISFFALTSAVFVMPRLSAYVPEFSSIIKGYTKLLVTFLFFTVGFSFKDDRGIRLAIKFYAFSAVFVALMGVIASFSDASYLSQFLFWYGLRLKGLMSDPNYFSVIQVTALVYFLRMSDIRMIFRWMAITVLVLSILISGSKTGTLTLLMYCSIRFLEAILSSRISKFLVLSVLIISILLLIIVFPLISASINNSIEYLGNVIPQFRRISVLFIDFGEAVSEGGSSRKLTWGMGVSLIFLSPAIGVGVGTYTDLSLSLFGKAGVAHNTYIQIFAEWGIFLGIAFLSVVSYLLIKASSTKRESSLLLRDMLIVLLIGSLGISLNNARMFWFFLGLLASNILLEKAERP